MPLSTGTLSLSDILANRFISVYEFGENTIQQIMLNDLQTHNKIVNDMVSLFADITSDKQRLSGSAANGSMTRVDETGRAPTQKITTGAMVGFPLYKFQYNIGWNSEFMKLTGSAYDMAIQLDGAEKAHLRQVQVEIKRAIYTATDTTFYEWLTVPANNAYPLTLKAFYNADGDPIQEGPNGEQFATSHTHYLGTASLVNADVLAVVNTVVEHGFGAGLCLFINAADEATVRALSGFSAAIDNRFTINTAASVPSGFRLDPTVANNRPIGYFGAATVWVKPWALASYFFACSVQTGNKPLVLRQRDQDILNGLRVVAQNDSYPLHAQFMEAVFGFGVWNRGNGAVLYTGNATYATPTILDP